MDTATKKKRVLVYYGPDSNPAGYLEFCNQREDKDNARPDEQIWNSIAHVTQAQLDRFATFDEFQTRSDLSTFHPAIAEKLQWEGMGTRAQQEKFRSAREGWIERERRA